MHKVIGLDIGYGHTKVVSAQGAHSFPSVVGSFVNGLGIEIGSKKRDIVNIEEGQYLIGEDAVRHSGRKYQSRERNWLETPAYKALASFAVARYSNGAKMVTLVTGLPVAFYKADKERQKDLLQSLVLALHKNVAVKVLPQPLGTFFDHLLDGEGGVKDEALAAEKVGILDVGFYTTDAVTLDSLEIVEKQIEGFEIGVSTALTEIAKAISDKYDIPLDLHKVENVVKAGSIKVFGKDMDITDIAVPCLKSLAAEISARAKTLWKSGADLDRIILAGGGAELLRLYLADIFPHALIAGNAQFANASGFYKYGSRHV